MAKTLTCLIVTITDEDESVTQKVVTQTSFFIGRSHECAIAFPKLNVSRQHVRVKNKGGNVWIEDLSANGTYINGTKIDKNRLTALEPGDQLRLGSAKSDISIVPLERCFSEEVFDETDVSEKDRDSMMNLIHAAHAESLRLTNLGKEVHDNFVKAAEERAKTLEQKTISDHTAIMAEAKSKARGIMEQAQKDRDVMIAKAEHEAVVAAQAMTAKINAEAREYAEKKAKEDIRDTLNKLENHRAECEAAKEQVEAARREIKGARAEMDKTHAETKRFQQESEDLKIAIKDMREQEKRRESVAKDLAKIIQQTETAEQQLTKRLADNKAKIEDDIASGRRLILEELAQFRHAESDRLKNDKRELDKHRADLANQVTKLTEQLAATDREQKKIVAEHRAAMEKERAEGRKAIEDEFTQLKLTEMEKLKRDRTAALSEIARERERLGEKILIDMETAAAKTMPLDNWRQVTGELKEVLKHHLELPDLTGADQDLSPMINKAARDQKVARWRHMGIGLVMGLIVWAASVQIVERTNVDPMKAMAEENARRVQEDMEKRKFNPPQDEEWRDSYVDSVIYTKNFVEQYRSEAFQKHWVKTASTYFLKKWKVQEESTVATISKISTLIGTLAERKAAIHPDFVKSGLKKMTELETATLAEVKELLGSEVRIEAFKRIEKKTYLDFYAVRQPAAEEPKPAVVAEEPKVQPKPKPKPKPAAVAPRAEEPSLEEELEADPEASEG
jgi:predicted component of type VI protein secretion system